MWPKALRKVPCSLGAPPAHCWKGGRQAQIVLDQEPVEPGPDGILPLRGEAADGCRGDAANGDIGVDEDSQRDGLPLRTPLCPLLQHVVEPA